MSARSTQNVETRGEGPSASDRLAKWLIGTFSYAFWRWTPMRLRDYLLRKAVRTVYYR